MLAELLATERVEEHVVLRAGVGFMALHGGLEVATAEIAELAASESGSSLYAIVQPDDLRWHIPSALHDPDDSAGLATFLGHVSTVFSIHGFGRDDLPDAVLLGGSDRAAAAALGRRLRETTDLDVIDDLDAVPAGLRGTHPDNPVNLAAGGGVQVELSPGARAPSVVDSVVAALVETAVAAMQG